MMNVKKSAKWILVLILVVVNANVDAQVKQLSRWLSQDAGSRQPLPELNFSNVALSKKQAREAAAMIMADFKQQLKLELDSSWKKKEITLGEHSLKFDYKIFGDKPKDGRSLFISMHGGGNAPPRTNDQQWRNQIGLYKPTEGVYLAPRAPTNTWNLWHEQHIDSLFDLLIQAAVLFEEVNPDKVYLMGYSAGGDGVYQLAPRMSDRFAAAAMMAGHPNETSPLGLRNLPFTLHMGALDSAYNRNKIAGQWSVLLDSLNRADPGGYKHFVQLHAGRAHWMNREDTVAIPWMQAFKRNTIPSRIVWKQDDVNHFNYYWLAVSPGSLKTGGEVIASHNGNHIEISKNDSDTLIVNLNDNMVNLDKPITISYLGNNIYSGKAKRNISVIYQTAKERKDPGLIFYAQIIIVQGSVLGNVSR